MPNDTSEYRIDSSTEKKPVWVYLFWVARLRVFDGGAAELGPPFLLHVIVGRSATPASANSSCCDDCRRSRMKRNPGAAPPWPPPGARVGPPGRPRRQIPPRNTRARSPSRARPPFTLRSGDVIPGRMRVGRTLAY